MLNLGPAIMSHNANTDKAHLKLIKRYIPQPHMQVQEDEFDFDFGEDLPSFPSKIDLDLEHIHSFSALLQSQSKTLQRIRYFSEELEFNLD